MTHHGDPRSAAMGCPGSNVNTVMKKATINNLGMAFRSLQAVGDPKNRAAHFLPLLRRCRQAYAVDDDRVVYAGTEPVRRYRSEDKGNTWEELKNLLDLPDEVKRHWKSPQPQYQGHVRHIFIDRDDPQNPFQPWGDGNPAVCKEIARRETTRLYDVVGRYADKTRTGRENHRPILELERTI